MNEEVRKQADDTPSSAQEETKTRLTVGQRLRAEREKMQVTWEDVYQDTRIPIVHLEALEDDKFEDLPSEGVVKGFIRNYSKFLKLDPDELIEQLTETDPRNEELTPVSFGKSIKKGGFFRDMQGSAIILGLAVFAFVILIAAVAIWWFGTNQGEQLRDSGEVSQSVSTEDVDQDDPTTIDVPSPVPPQPSDPIDEPTIGSTTDGAESLSLDSTSTEEEAVEDFEEDADSEGVGDFEEGGELFSTPNNPTATTFPLNTAGDMDEATSQESEDAAQLDSTQSEGSSTEDSSAEEESHDLEFTFDDISWVQVSDGTGTVLVNGVQEAETTLNLDGEAPFDIRIGKATAVKLLYRGEEVALGQYTQRNNTAIFTLQP